jgi:hypothetical protein
MLELSVQRKVARGHLFVAFTQQTLFMALTVGF